MLEDEDARNLIRGWTDMRMRSSLIEFRRRNYVPNPKNKYVILTNETKLI